MTMGQEPPVPFRCPRCGSPMYKPAGSSFYWHADYTHSRCEITNILDVSTTSTPPDDPSDLPPQGKTTRKRS